MMAAGVFGGAGTVEKSARIVHGNVLLKRDQEDRGKRYVDYFRK